MRIAFACCRTQSISQLRGFLRAVVSPGASAAARSLCSSWRGFPEDAISEKGTRVPGEQTWAHLCRSLIPATGSVNMKDGGTLYEAAFLT